MTTNHTEPMGNITQPVVDGITEGMSGFDSLKAFWEKNGKPPQLHRGDKSYFVIQDNEGIRFKPIAAAGLRHYSSLSYG